MVRPVKSGLAPLVLALLALAVAGPAYAANSSPLGDWLTEDRQGVIRVEPCGDALCGVIVGLSDWPADGSKLLDWEDKPQCHLAIIKDMHPGDDDRYHGTVTNPEDGHTYDAQMWVPEDGVLRLRGFVAIALLGSTQHWPRSHKTVLPDCHFH